MITFDFLFHIALSSILIAVVLWIARTNTVLAGFVLALPLSTMIVLALHYFQSQNLDSTYSLAKSTFVALPLTLVFFVPFLLAPMLSLPFWVAYLFGVSLLGLAYCAHQYFVRAL